MELQEAKGIIRAEEWGGDVRSVMWAIHRAAKVVLARLDELEPEGGKDAEQTHDGNVQ